MTTHPLGTCECEWHIKCGRLSQYISGLNGQNIPSRRQILIRNRKYLNITWERMNIIIQMHRVHRQKGSATYNVLYLCIVQSYNDACMGVHFLWLLNELDELSSRNNNKKIWYKQLVYFRLAVATFYGLADSNTYSEKDIGRGLMHMGEGGAYGGEGRRQGDSTIYINHGLKTRRIEFITQCSKDKSTDPYMVLVQQGNQECRADKLQDQQALC